MKISPIIFIFTIVLLTIAPACASVSTQTTIHASLDGNVTVTTTPTVSPTTTHHSSGGGGGGGGGSSTFTPKPQPTTITTTPTLISQHLVPTTPAPTTLIPTITTTATISPVVITGDGSGMVWGIVIIVVIGVTIVSYLWYRRRLENSPPP